MIDVETAWQCVLDHTWIHPPIRLSLHDALHHYLAVPVRADRDIPACDRAAMDGFAVRAADLAQVPATLIVAGEVPAGSPAQPRLQRGECVHIFTGGNVPPDADTVVKVEDTEPGAADGDRVRFLEPVVPGQHIFRGGENARKGDVLLAEGTLLNATTIGLCATVGYAFPEVHEKPRVAVLTTGTELRDADEPVERHEIRDSNGPMLAALLAANHFSCSERRSAPDDVDSLREVLQDLLAENDVILVTGGVSVGKYDLVPAAVEKAGGSNLFHGVRMKPGKPQLLGMFRDGKHVFGLPGNPLSVMTGAQEFALPSLRRRAGCPPGLCRPLLRLPLARAIEVKGSRQQYVLGRFVQRDGQSAVEPVPRVGSADLGAGAKADGTIIVSPGAKLVAEDTIVDFRPWEGLG